MGCPPTQQLLKHIYLHACYELYSEKLEKATQGWVFESSMDLPGVRVEVEKILSNDNIDKIFFKGIHGRFGEESKSRWESPKTPSTWNNLQQGGHQDIR